MSTPTLDLTIIIPNYNTRELVLNCIASIFRFTAGIDFEVIFIDDNSRDGSAEAVAAAFPQVIVVHNKSNQLYVRNNNLGMSMSRARFACLLNSDTVLVSNAFAELVRFMDDNPKVAACGPRLINPDGSVQHCIRRFVGPGTLLLQAIGWHKWFTRSGSMQRLYALDFDYSAAQRVDSIGTTAFVLRRSTWEQAGMLDDRFRLFVVDWAYNFMLLKKGYEVWYTPCADVVHYGSQSVNQNASNSIRDLHQALITFSDAYNYFGSNPFIKRVVRIAVRARCALKLAELRLGRDKRVIKGPGAPTFQRQPDTPRA
jgi:GT2 family glycosyltransferase